MNMYPKIVGRKPNKDRTVLTGNVPVMYFDPAAADGRPWRVKFAGDRKSQGFVNLTEAAGAVRNLCTEAWMPPQFLQ